MKDSFDALFEMDKLDITDDVYTEISSDREVDVNLDLSDDLYCTQTNSSVYITQNYNDVANKPSIEGVTLIGDKTFQELNFKIDVIECGTSTKVI